MRGEVGADEGEAAAEKGEGDGHGALVAAHAQHAARQLAVLTSPTCACSNTRHGQCYPLLQAHHKTVQLASLIPLDKQGADHSDRPKFCRVQCARLFPCHASAGLLYVWASCATQHPHRAREHGSHGCSLTAGECPRAVFP